MRCPKCHTETPPTAANCPGCNLATPKGKKDKARLKEKEFEKKTRKFFLSGLTEKAGISGRLNIKQASSRTKSIIRIAVMVCAIAATGFGCYLVVFSYWESKEVDPVSAVKAMEKLKLQPSNQEGLTVDELMTDELNKLKKANTLKGYQGWHIKKVKGSESRLVVVFSYQDVDGQDHRAEWMTDVNSETFVPQTELAISVYNK